MEEAVPGPMCNSERPPLGSTESSSLGSSTSSDKTSSSSSIDEEPKMLQLTAPGGGLALSFEFRPPNNDFVEILRMALIDNQALGFLLRDFSILNDNFYSADYETMKKVSEVFNKVATANYNLAKGQTNPSASPQLLRRILTFCYNKAVTNEKALNKHYEAFSSETYGETSFDRMQLILDEIKPNWGDVFVDLGSGVGQLVAHVAGGTKVNQAFGIEIAHLPSQFGAKLEEEFRRLMRFYGKNVSPFSLERGDFLSEKYRDTITNKATIIFINNFAFTAELETKIKSLLLCELNHGTRVITTKPYVAVGKSVNERHMNDISSIMDVVQLQRCDNPCSWTSADVPYYLHTVNRGKLERYFSERQLIRSSESRPSSTPSSRNSNSRESSVGFRDRKNGRRGSIPFGATTRKKWNEQTGDKKPKVLEVSGEPKDPNKPRLTSGHHEDDEFSSEPDSEEERKRKRAAKKAKDLKKAKEKPRRSTKQEDSKTGKKEFAHSSNGTKLSIDAEEGMELMHRMTCAVNEGRTVEQEALLAGIAKTRRRAPSNGKKQQASMLVQPLLQMMSSPNLLKKANTTNKKDPFSSKYPELNVFIGELIRVFEAFLDSIQTPEFVQSVQQKLGAEKFATGTPSDGQQAGSSNPGGASSVNLDAVLQQYDRIQVKQAELSDEFTSLRKMIVALGQPAAPSPAKTNGPIIPQPVAGGLLSPTSVFTQPDPSPAATALKILQGLDTSLLTPQDVARAMTAATSFGNTTAMQSYAALSSAVTPQQLSPNVHPTANLALGTTAFAASNNPLEATNQFGAGAQVNGMNTQQFNDLYRHMGLPTSQPQLLTSQLLQTASQNGQFLANTPILANFLSQQLLSNNPPNSFAPTNNSSFLSTFSLDAGSSVGPLPSVNSTPAPPARKSRSKKEDVACEMKNESELLPPDSNGERQSRTKNKRSRGESTVSPQKYARFQPPVDLDTKRNCLENGGAVGMPPAVETLLNGTLSINSRLSNPTEKSFAS